MYRLVLFLLFVSSTLSAQDYRVYHRYINNAERCFFMEKKVDSADRYYDSAFAKFDFVFAKDCFMAAQIAYSRKNSRYIAYFRKGFQNGLVPNHLKLSKVFADLVTDSSKFMRNYPDYRELRQHYLKRINVPVLKKTLMHYAVDQSEKHLAHDDLAKYVETLNGHLDYILLLAANGLFPGDKLIGIDQVDIMKELGYEKSDSKDIYEAICKRPPNKHLTMDLTGIDDRLSVDISFPLLDHHPCAFDLFANYWGKLIENGQVHPRDVGVINDFHVVFGNQSDREKEARAFSCPPIKWDLMFGVEKNVAAEIGANRIATDLLREKYFICPLAQDAARWKFEKDSGFLTTFGNGWNR